MKLPKAEAERFLRRTLGVMSKLREHGNIVLRIGTTGTGVAPNYRIEIKDGDHIVAIDGANHQPWPEGSTFDGAENWSTATMTYADVQGALAAVMPAKRDPPT
ncbi:hypothetical protein E0504_20350 [Parafrankia sp. BMG5.11]|nr:hypothetical protein E0504_20350 [Parafrankia sp. BMG5.11]